ncbi:MAG: hypothetical protein OEX99_04620, partial [Candidatus Bathyarchaeota archaeon]|nr:hypothetical protein [Candidatus Bathyarchaeota archaeon]
CRPKEKLLTRTRMLTILIKRQPFYDVNTLKRRHHPASRQLLFHEFLVFHGKTIKYRRDTLPNGRWRPAML